MKSNEYLYGEDAEVPEIPAEIKMRRVEILKEQLEIELDKHYGKRNQKRVRDIMNAIEFWENIE